jgi:predicted dehydrogenase
MRDSGLMIALKKQLEEGAIGNPVTISFGGQHPLNYGSRPDWYFEEGKHGGTLNDIAIHGIDFVMWLTGSPVSEILSARCWNGRLPEVPFFQDSAQCMFSLENGCGVFGDVSYLSPDSFGYSFPLYWRVTVHGSGGVMETRRDHIALWKDGEKEMRRIQPEPSRVNGYLDDFLAEIKGNPSEGSLTTPEVLRSSKFTLLAQAAADAE